MMKYLLIPLQITVLIAGIYPKDGACIDFQFLLFPEINAALEDYSDPGYDLNPGIDFFASIRYRDLSLIGEYFLNKNEAELERLLLGFDASDSITIWAGRHHTFTGYWNTEFHHGAFLETSITRPAITEFEDDDGILPTHATGIAGDVRFPLGDGQLRISSILGLGPVYKSEQELAAFDVLNPRTSDHDGTFSVRLSYIPAINLANQLGIATGGAIIPSTAAEVNSIDQFYIGPYINWYFGNLRLISEGSVVLNRVHRPAGSFNANVFPGYLQAEYRFDSHWTVYGRIEATAGQIRNLGVVFPGYVTDRQVTGVRLDIGSQNALKLEIGRRRDSNGARGEARIQWSAVFP